MEDGWFADAGGEGREVGGTRSGECGRGRSDFVAETAQVLLRGGDSARGEELLEPHVELRVVGTCRLVAQEGEEGGCVIGAQREMEKDNAVGFSFAQVETGASATFEAEGVREVVLHLVGGTEAGVGLSDGEGEFLGESREERGASTRSGRSTAGLVQLAAFGRSIFQRFTPVAASSPSA